jgi:hypothetical protein
MRDRDGSSGRPNPSRRRRACWIALGVLIAVAALVGLFAYRLSCDEESLAGVVAEIRRRGEPIEWREFQPEPVRLEEDAANLYRQAVRRVQGEFRAGAPKAAEPDPNAERRADLSMLLRGDVVIHPGLRAQRSRDVRDILALSRDVLSLCRRARGRKSADWGLTYQGPAMSCPLPSLSDLAVLSGLLCLAALRAQEEGRPAEAAEYLRDALALAESVEAMPTLVSFMTAEGMREAVCTVVEQRAPDPSVRPRDPAAPRAVRRLIGDLLGPDRFPRAVMGERSILYDMAERVRSGQIPLSTLTTWPRGGALAAIRNFRLGMVAPSFYVSDEIELLEAMGRHVEASKARTYTAALAALRKPPGTPDRDDRGPLARALWPSFRRIYKIRYRVVARRRLAAAALAIRLYELDHGGRGPARLQELAPQYLPAVPADPFAADAAPIRHLPDAKRPVLYSVFKNGTDEGGEFTVGSTGYVGLVDSPDLVFFLRGGRPVPRVEDAFPSSRPSATAP